MNSLRIKAVLIVSCVVLYVLAAALWMGCNRFVGQYIGEKLHGIEGEYNISVSYEDISFKGLHKVEILKPAVILADGDTLAKANSLTINLKLSSLLFFRAEVTGTDIDGLNVGFVRKGLPADPETDYASKAKQHLDRLFRILPREVSLKNLNITYRENGEPGFIHIKNLDIKDSRFETEIVSSGQGEENGWICKGLLLEEEQRIDFRLYAKEGSRITLPFTAEKFGTTIRLDTLAFEMRCGMQRPGILNLKGKGGVKGLAVYDNRLATDTVLLNRGFANFDLDIGKNFIEVKQNTEIQLNKLKLNPYIRIEKDTDWHITASLEKKGFPASELFGSIPKGLFHNIEGLETEGTLDYNFLLDVDMADVERLKFVSTLDSRNFHIVKQGFTDLRMLNEPFTHTIYEKGVPVRTFVMGRSNPDFRPYRQISRFLPPAIMHAEDADFMTHKGFYPGAFRKSLIQDIQERRFARGGSSLSMQTVKNVFLTRNKTIARKLEEITIVWLIETCRLSTKERMFEVYMNVIEWGPDVYGITEAARYYFGKDPSALTLTECIFLGYILPAPKQVKDHFDGLTIKPEFRPFLLNAIKRLHQRNWINARDRASANLNLRITGPAAEYLAE